MSTYLSQIRVSKVEAAHSGLRDPYAWHQALWRAFPGRDDEPRRFLFRVDDRHDHFRLLLLSPERPVVPSWGEWRTKEVAPGFLDHQRYRFQLRANPTVKRVVRLDDGSRKRNGRRTGISDEEGLMNWLERKAAQSGFDLVEATPGPPLSVFFTKDDGKRQGKHNSVDFQGFLRVTDREAFERAFHRGIGPAKAFGFGLLMLQPVD